MQDARVLTDKELQDAVDVCVKRRRQLEAADDVYSEEYLCIIDEHRVLDDEQLRRAKRAQESSRWAFEQAFK